MSRQDRRAEDNERRTEEARAGGGADGGRGSTWAKRAFPGPRWAYAVRFLPGVGLIGDFVIFRARRNQRREQRRGA